VITYTRPYIYDYQRCIIDSTSRYTITEASTKVGKTTTCYIWLHEQALKGKQGYNYWWVAPIYNQAKIAFTRLRNALRVNDNYSFNKSELSITCPNGAIIMFKSADNADNLYGEDVYACVFDEFTRAKQDSWFALRSTLSATKGAIQFIGNVRGRGWGYQLAQTAKNDLSGQWKYNVITAIDAANGGLVTKDGLPFIYEVEDAKKVLPIDVFNELYLCIPTDTGANPFGLNHIASCIKPMSNLPAKCYGIDLAKSVDYTVIIGLDVHGSVCYIDRFQNDWNVTMTKIKALGKQTLMMVDSTGVGDSPVELLQLSGMNVQGFKFTSTSKQQLMVDLQSAIQQRLISYPQGVIVDELNSYEFSYSSTGVKYSAPSGQHDDCVCALALARAAFKKSGTQQYNMMSV